MEDWALSKSNPWWRLKQSYLGSSSQGTLCILPCPWDISPSRTLGKCFISTLPDELLAEVLEFLAPPSYFLHNSQYEQLLPILFVCRRWRRLYEPLLYRRIDLGYNGWEKLRRTYRLLETLKQRPELRACVRETDIQLFKINDTTSGAIADILRYCESSLRKLSLHTRWESSAIWPILCTIRNFPRLEALRFSGYEGGPALQMILTHFDGTVLKTLALSRYGLSFGDGPGAPWNSANATGPPFISASAENLLAAHRIRGKVTTLKLNDPSAPLHITELLVHWPACLVSLTLTNLTQSKFWGQYSVRAVQRCLDYHCHSLEHVTLGILASDANHMPEFSHFPKLQTLQISSYNILFERTHVAAAKLSGAPSMLRHLSVSFCTEDQHQESFKEFGAERLRWMEDFAGRMTTKGTTSDGKTFNRLQTIHVEFNPDDYLPSWSGEEALTGDMPSWPWQHVDQAAQALSKLGTRMTYSTPSMSKREWFRMLKRARRKARRRRARAAAATSVKAPSGVVIVPDAEVAAPEAPRGIKRYFSRL